MSLVVTGATGSLGRLVVTGLLDAGVPAGQVTALVRDPSRAADLAARGVALATADYADRGAVDAALAGATRVLLVSGTEFGQRVAQHTTVIEAARAAGVELLAYTSAPKASTSSLVLAPEHAATEQALAASGLPGVVLRNNWYWENYDAQIGQAAATGRLIGVGDGGVAWPAARADHAGAAVAVLTDDTVRPATLELDGDAPLTMPELAAEVARQTGRPVEYTPLSADDHERALLAAGLDGPTAGFLTALATGITAGDIDTGGGGVRRLTGRLARTLAEHVARVLAG